MGIDWEELLGDTSYEDAVEIARESLEKGNEEVYNKENPHAGVMPWEDEDDRVERSKIPGTNRRVIPTLFKMGKIQENENGLAEAFLNRIYDSNICSKYMKNGYIYNALLPYTKALNKAPYAYKGEKEEIQFLLPETPDNRMLFLELIARDEEAEQYKDKCFARVTFWNKQHPQYSDSKKGKIVFRFGLKEYEEYQTFIEEYLVIEDLETNTRFAFQCWTEQLPVPGKDGGMYAYVDGSAGDVENPTHFGSGSVVSAGNKVYFSHCEEEDSGRNVSAEYLAATKVFEGFPKECNDIKELRIYYDNNNVGYVPAGLYKPGTKYAHAYGKALENFEKENPKTLVTFVHTDGHSGIFGNEMADQMAERKKKELEKLTPGFEAKRKALCPEDGSYSEPLTIVDCQERKR